MVQMRLTRFRFKRYWTILSFALLLLSQSATAQNWGLSSLTGICPQPVNCAPGSSFIRLSDANLCGCCACHGGAQGCSGGAKGRIICQDGTVASSCVCQYTVVDP